jgi:hypothetical protein
VAEARRRQHLRANIADSFAACGIILTRPINARLVDGSGVREYLAAGPGRYAHWAFFPRLAPIWRVPCRRWLRPKQKGEDAAGGEDHAPESLRYALMSRPGLCRAKKETQLPWPFRSQAANTDDGLIKW